MIHWLIMGYFVVLFAERAQSLIRSFRDPEVSVWGSGFNRYVNGICIASLAAFLILLFTANGGFLKALFVGGTAVDYRMLSITIGVILISGMVHTEYTVPGIQFASYGLLIVALIIRTAENSAAADSKVLLWMSLVYLIFFSMAIPVVYRSEIRNAALFHVDEALVSLILIAAFTYMTCRVLTGDAVDLFLICPIVLAVAGDVAVLAMRRRETVNSFVLIFLIASVAAWVAGVIVKTIVLR